MSSKTLFTGRLRLLRSGLEKRRLDSFLVTKDVNISYLSGFTGRDATILVTPDKAFFIADSRYIEEARDTIKGFKVMLAGRSLYEMLKEISKGERLDKTGFESMDLPYEVGFRLKRLIGPDRLTPVRSLVEEIRAVKDAGEIRLIRESIALTKKVFKTTLPLIQPGVSEKSLAGRIETAFINGGARPSFDPIVACGHNCSKPHATPGYVRIPKNGYVMVDMGCSLNGYCSDMTRMIKIGRTASRMDKVCQIVRTAQAMAIDAIRPGKKTADIDKVARGYIESKGFGRYFGHALGHGVGMEVHEKPTISSLDEGVLRPGEVFTVEPAIYIPKAGGIRIEDMVLVTDRGCEVLSN